MTATRRIIVSLHAISRWRERAQEGANTGTDDEIRVRIGSAMLHSRPVRLRSAKERISKAIIHGKLAQYLQSGGVVLVLADDTVLSVYAYERDRWEAIP